MTIIFETISLIHVFIIVFVIQGISATFWEGHIFEKPGDYLERKTVLWKPLVGCPICMSPWWGSAMQIILWEYWNPTEWIVVMGINAVIIRLTKDDSKLEEIEERVIDVENKVEQIMPTVK